MPKKSTPASAPKIMDVAHPRTVKATATSVPIILNHRPIMKDPMMTDKSEEVVSGAPAVQTKPKDEPIIRKIELQPLASESHEENEPSPTPDMLLKLDAESIPEVAADGPAAQAIQVTTKRKLQPLSDEDKASAEQAETTTDEPAEIKEKPTPTTDTSSAATTKNTPDTPNAAATTETTQAADTTEEKPAEETPAEPAADDLFSDAKPMDDEATKAARLAAEKQLAYDKLVAEGTYFLPVNSVEKRRVHQTLLAAVLIVLVLGVAGAVLALDAGYIHINGVSPPTNLIKN